MLEIPLKPDGSKDYEAFEKIMHAISEKVQTNAKDYDEAVTMLQAEGIDERYSKILASYGFPKR